MYTGPNITRENIILALDSANAKSYIGTGTTWNKPLADARCIILTQ
tara:strand:+ start:2597 stop:2734 length:138 start_codon:yes stop_codon:yes gene_type:complete